MAIHIEIIKIKEKDGIHYYNASTNDFGGENFYFSIDSTNRNMTLFKTNDFIDPIRSINFEKNEKLTTEGINDTILGFVFYKAYKAFKNKNFTQDISYCA